MEQLLNLGLPLLNLGAVAALFYRLGRIQEHLGSLNGQALEAIKTSKEIKANCPLCRKETL